jgi:uncharacterized protein (TIGR03545 family)
MKNIFRWNYVIPRLVVLTCLLLMLLYFSGPILKWTLIATGKSITTADVNIKEIKTDYLAGHLELIEVRAANPKKTNTDLFRFDKCSLDLNKNALFYKKLVIEKAEITGLQFDVERSKDGNIDDTPLTLLEQQLKKIGERIADQNFLRVIKAFKELSPEELSKQLETIQTANQIAVEWDNRFQNYHGRIEWIKQQGQAIETRIKSKDANVLNRIDQYAQAALEIDQVSNQIALSIKELDQIDELIQIDIQRLDAARKRDEQKIKDLAKLPEFSEQELVQYLLGEEIAEKTLSALSWYQWYQEHQFDVEDLPFYEREVGCIVPLKSAVEEPSGLIKELSIQGSGSHHDQPLEFASVIKNVSPNPESWIHPIACSVRTSGAVNASMHGTIDRRHDQPHTDQFVFSLGQLKQDSKQLGNPSELLLQLSPGMGELQAHLTVTDGKYLSGKVTYYQPNTSIGCAIPQDNPLAFLQPNINQVLSSVNELSFTVNVSGTSENPQVKVDSQFAKELADRLKVATQQQLFALQQHSIQQLNQYAFNQSQEVQSAILGNQQYYMNQVNLHQAQLKQVQQLIASLKDPLRGLFK